jgi:general secretion pathway protein D
MGARAAEGKSVAVIRILRCAASLVILVALAVAQSEVAQVKPAAPVPPPDKPQAPIKTGTAAQSAATPAAETPAPPPRAKPASVPPGLNLTNASLVEVIDILARDLKINYILDPKVTGKVTINTYGELRAVDLQNLLETILRMNGYAMVQVGNLYRIVPSGEAARLPVTPSADAKNLSDTEQPVLNLIFLKYVTSAEMAKLLDPFLGEGYKMVAYDPANLLIIQDNARNMKRTLELIAMFDAESMAGQRVQSFQIVNGRPSDLARDLDVLFKAYAFSEKNAAVRFIPIDRISTLIAVVSNPAAFGEVKRWIDKLDVPVKLTAGAIDNHVYKLKYGRAEIIGNVVSQLYGTSVPGGNSSYGLQGYGGGTGLLTQRNGLGPAGFGSSGGGYGNGGGSMFGGTSGQSGSFGVVNNGGANTGFGAAPQIPPTTGAAPAAGAPAGGTPFGEVAAGTDQTGQYLAPSARSGVPGAPRIIPNPYDNTLLVQGTPQQWESILHLLEQIDVPPRQVLIDAKIYEVDLTGQLQYGVEASLQAKDSSNRQLTGGFDGLSSSVSNILAPAGAGATFTAGMLVGHSRELLAAVNLYEQKSLARSIAAPQLIATDSIPASITVGQEIPTLSATSVSTGLGGSTTSAVSTVGTGVSLNVIARVNASGVVTLVVDQDVSAPTTTSFSDISSPSFNRRNVTTQVTLEDGDTIAIGGIIQSSKSITTTGIPYLDRIPYIGGLFGNKAVSTTRTELIIFLTPHVIYDTTQIADATEELRNRMRDLKKDMKDLK